MFAPKWVKEAKLLSNGAKKYLNYKRDLLKPDRIAEIESRRADLLAAIKAGDKEKADEAGKQLRATCEKALPSHLAQTGWEEQVEVIWVALVVALGLRTYVLQPFRIPTGSMQPTLNGIIVQSFDKPDEESPNLLKQGLDFVMKGRTYKKIVAEADCEMESYKEKSMLFLTRTEIKMTDGTVITMPAAANEAERPFVVSAGPGRPPRRKTFKKGDVIFNGFIDSGDLVLVDKISYNFRSPKRGEVFVFDTRALHTTRPWPGERQHTDTEDQEEGTHYIKRLVAVPGDRVQIDPPYLMINGSIASEFGMKRVMDAQGVYAKGVNGRVASGYQLIKPDSRYPTGISSKDQVVTLADKDMPRGMREYMAMGDNTGTSLDSRYWGPVKEYNIVGTGFFSLWPFNTGHWGFIK